MSFLLLLIAPPPLPSLPAADNWRHLGPECDDVYLIVPDRQHPALWYAAAASGPKVSRDAGRTWKQVNLPGAPADLGVSAIMVNPSNSDVHVAGSSQRRIAEYLWISQDFGRSFRLQSHSTRFQRVFGHASGRPGVLLATMDGAPLQISRNSGKTWQLLKTPPPPPLQRGCTAPPFEFIDAMAMPWNDREIYVSGDATIACGPGPDPVEYDIAATWRSRDGGAHWQQVDSAEYFFHYDPIVPDLVFAAFPLNQPFRTITPRGPGNYSKSKLPITEIQSVPGNPDQVVALTSDFGTFLFSGDLGSNWSSLGSARVRARDFALVPDTSLGILAASEFGVFYRDSAHPWAEIDHGLTGALITTVHRASDPSVIYATRYLANAQFSVVYRSTDSGASWMTSGINSPRLGTDIAVDPKDPDHLAAVSTNSAFLITHNGGATWSITRPPSGYLYSGAVAFDPLDPARLYAAAGAGFFVSNDGGKSFKAGTRIDPYNITQIVVDHSNPHIVYLVPDADGIWKSIDAGKHFHQLKNSAPPGAFFNNLLPLGPPGAYIGTLFNGGPARYTLDGGDTWQAMQGTAGFGRIVSADATGRHLIAVAYRRLLESTDGGTTWNDISGTLHSLRDIYDVDASGHRVLAATSNGVWEQAR